MAEGYTLSDELKANSYRADNHEGTEIVIQLSRVEEIIGERGLIAKNDAREYIQAQDFNINMERALASAEEEKKKYTETTKVEYHP